MDQSSETTPRISLLPAPATQSALTMKKKRAMLEPPVVRGLNVMVPLVCTSAAMAFGPSPSMRIGVERASKGREIRLAGVTVASGGAERNNQVEDDDSDIQWELFLKHHAKGSWKGIWTTYDYIGDVVGDIIASVDLIHDPESGTVEQAHQIVVGAKRSDCLTCFDSFEVKTLPVATFSKRNLGKTRFAACGMASGPSLLRSGAMATELALRHGDGRIRVIFQHAPAWQRGVEAGGAPPDVLKFFRATVSREALRGAPPAAETERANPPTGGNPVFSRPVPPFHWHKQWAGTSWTWGPNTGNQGWGIEALEEPDAWHGMAPVEVWNLRLPGGVFVQCPRVFTPDAAGSYRLAWLPNDETLLRMEASVLCLQPVFDEEETTLLGLEPPSLASLRCDVLVKMGDLEGEPQFVRDAQEAAKMEEENSAADRNQADEKMGNQENDTDGDLKDARDALRL